MGKAYKIGDEKNLIDIRLGKFSIAAMIDSGASISCLSFDMYRRSGLSKEYPMQQSDIKNAETVDGTCMHVMGKVVVSLTICRLTLCQTFYVFRKLNQSVILGRDFLKDQRAWVDFGEDILQIQGGLVVVKMFSSPQKSCLARLVNRVSIAPQSVSIVKVKVKGQGLEGLSLIEPVSEHYQAKIKL